MLQKYKRIIIEWNEERHFKNMFQVVIEIWIKWSSIVWNALENKYAKLYKILIKLQKVFKKDMNPKGTNTLKEFIIQTGSFNLFMNNFNVNKLLSNKPQTIPFTILILESPKLESCLQNSPFSQRSQTLTQVSQIRLIWLELSERPINKNGQNC